MMQTIKATNQKVITIINALGKVKQMGPVPARFAYAVARCQDKLQAPYKAIGEAETGETLHGAFYKAKVKLFEAARADAKKVKDQKSTEGKAALKAINITLNEKVEKLLEKHKAGKKEFQALLDAEVDIEIYPIDLDWLPADIEAGIMADILPLIKEETEA